MPDLTTILSAKTPLTLSGVPTGFQPPLLADLARAGIVESVRGVGGGYRFAGNARRLTLMDIIARFEDIAPRPPGTTSTPIERGLDTVLAEIDENARATFGSITVATMLRLVERQAAAEPVAEARPRVRARAV